MDPHHLFWFVVKSIRFNLTFILLTCFLCIITHANTYAEVDAPPQSISSIVRIVKVDSSWGSAADSNPCDGIGMDVGSGKEELIFLVRDIDNQDAFINSEEWLFVDIECLQDDIVVEGVDLILKSFKAGLFVTGRLGGSSWVWTEDATPLYHVFLIDAAPATNEDKRIFKFDEDSKSFSPFIPFSLSRGKSHFKFDFTSAKSGRGTYELSISVKRKNDPAFSKIVLVEDIKLAFMDFINTDNHDEAIPYYSKIIEIYPDCAAAYSERGDAYYIKGSYDEAISDYSKSIEIGSDYPNNYRYRGHAYYMKGLYDEAISDYSKLIEKYDSGYHERGDAYAKKGQYEKAISDYSRAIVLNSNVDAYNSIAWLLATCPDDRYRDGNKAMRLSEKSVEIKEEAKSLGTLAASYAEYGRFEDAIMTQEKAIDLLKREEAPINKIDEYMERLNSYKANKPWREK